MVGFAKSLSYCWYFPVCFMTWSLGTGRPMWLTWQAFCLKPKVHRQRMNTALRKNPHVRNISVKNEDILKSLARNSFNCITFILPWILLLAIFSIAIQIAALVPNNDRQIKDIQKCLYGCQQTKCPKSLCQWSPSICRSSSTFRNEEISIGVKFFSHTL